jgi:hypothetical protein
VRPTVRQPQTLFGHVKIGEHLGYFRYFENRQMFSSKPGSMLLELTKMELRIKIGSEQFEKHKNYKWRHPPDLYHFGFVFDLLMQR